MQHGLVTFGLLFPSGQGPAKVIHPAMSPLNDPTMGLAVIFLLASDSSLRDWICGS